MTLREISHLNRMFPLVSMFLFDYLLNKFKISIQTKRYLRAYSSRINDNKNFTASNALSIHPQHRVLLKFAQGINWHKYKLC